MAWLFVVMPLSGCFMFLFGLENLWEDCIQFKKILAGSEEA
jgi:TRAP-type C4-dicarboxylate transport system permease small subunit